MALAHFSVKEFLISDIIRQGKAARFHLDETDCHVALIKDCLAYLFHFDELGSLTWNVFAEYPLAQYAAMHLPRHARVAEKKAKAICQELFLTKGEAFRNWVRLHGLLYPIALDYLKFDDFPDTLRMGSLPLRISESTCKQRTKNLYSRRVRECLDSKLIHRQH